MEKVLTIVVPYISSSKENLDTVLHTVKVPLIFLSTDMWKCSAVARSQV